MRFLYFNDYQLKIIAGDEHYIQQGYLLDRKSTTAIPIVNNCVFSNETDVFIPSLLLPRIEALHRSLMESEAAYKQFIRTKGRRPSYDVYACFQPFNEALKSFYPFIKPLKKRLKKGDVILDLWNRSGWSAALLAGLFPEQQIVTLWEGNKDVLGYKGFNHWFAQTQDNIQVVFHELNKPLPFADNSVSFVYGLDALHRFDQALFLKELLRVSKPDAAIICPHVHLSNAEPVPFFERGCRQLHGRQYDELFNAMKNGGSNHHGFVFSEPELFWFNEMDLGKKMPIASTPDTGDYNALVALLPGYWLQDQLEPFGAADLMHDDKAYILVNPLFTIDLSLQYAKLDYDRMSGAVGKLLARHPVYEKRAGGTGVLPLDETACKLLYLATRLYSTGEIKTRLQLTDTAFEALLDNLYKHDLVQIVPVRQDLVRLQQFLSVQEYVLPTAEQTLGAVWDRAKVIFNENIFISVGEDGSEFTYADIDVLIQKTIATLLAKGIQKGDRICLVAPLHLEQIVMFWAAAYTGAVIVPLGHDLPAIKVQEILNEIEPSLILTDEERLAKLQHNRHRACVLLDSEEPAASNIPTFSEWLIDETTMTALPEIAADDLAVILFTSGSTGMPKGVMLPHGNLVRSARNITETFAWETKDIFFALGDMDSMSGLRNSCIAPAASGAAVFIPRLHSKITTRNIADAIHISGATIMAVSPVILRQMIHLKDEVAPGLSRIRMVMCTGSQLTGELKKQFSDSFNIEVFNYYGLTETTGICISESPASPCISADTIGRPVGCIAQVVNDERQVLSKGEQGELRIYSENIMSGYWNNPAHAENLVEDGWLYTGDIASVMDDGSVRLWGRRRDYIKSAYSEIVYAGEVESSLHALPGVKEVSACGFIADDTEKMAVFIVPVAETDAHSLIAKVKSYLAEVIGVRKIPSIVRVVDQLPYGTNHKVLKNKLIELL